jgi:hypothetical protein
LTPIYYCVIDPGSKFTSDVTVLNVNLGKDVTTGVIDSNGIFASSCQFATGVTDDGAVAFQLR